MHHFSDKLSFIVMTWWPYCPFLRVGYNAVIFSIRIILLRIKQNTIEYLKNQVVQQLDSGFYIICGHNTYKTCFFSGPQFYFQLCDQHKRQKSKKAKSNNKCKNVMTSWILISNDHVRFHLTVKFGCKFYFPRLGRGQNYEKMAFWLLIWAYFQVMKYSTK